MTDRDADENGWLSSSEAWMNRISDRGDFAREHILDRLMMQRVKGSGASSLLDIGCGEGRFCRMTSKLGLATTGIDPVAPFITHARQADPSGRYHIGFAEDLPFDDDEFEIAVFYLSLIDIDDLHAAIAEATRVLKPEGRILIANLTSFFTSNGTIGWIKDAGGRPHHPLGTYLEEKADWFEWDGVHIRNWHRPLSGYLTALLNQGLTLTYFDEPTPTGGPPERIASYLQTPFTMVMEWKK